ncbi:YrrS family protein [Mangrovibacillus cuniculi]|uniref:DUF1510 family protein n=1 Tax=Mangrovibacillus cuniculi TaxID=2593652 RepID=A0A7S8CBK0_9BACI|nr:YrrS family protein [Mangrovibacillus cuniculi]QPC46982.1 DUF1510 family protein [Mangrovibacillus cuniculi]
MAGRKGEVDYGFISFSPTSKKRKTNFVLNSLIAIVIILILVVSASIFGLTNRGDNNQAASESTNEEANTNDQVESEQDTSSDENTETEDTETEDSELEEQQEKEEVDLESGQEGMVVEESTENNVKTTAQNPNWQPVGTEQSNFSNSFDQGTVDWNEKLKAVSYATGLSIDDMIVWRMERGGDPATQAVATVTPKDQSENYRVYLQWVDGQGWKPTEVQTLVKNDKKSG